MAEGDSAKVCENRCTESGEGGRWHRGRRQWHGRPRQIRDDLADREHGKDSWARRGSALVYPKSPAAEAGIRMGDRVVRIDDVDCDSIAKAIAAMNTYAPGAKISVHILRDDKPMDVSSTSLDCQRMSRTSCHPQCGPQQAVEGENAKA